MRSRRPLVAVLAALLVGVPLSTGVLGQASPPSPAAGATHADLVALFKEFRKAAVPQVVAGVPDYSDAAMARQLDALRGLQARLAAIDSRGWPVAQRADHLLVTAEMRGLEFQHRVVRPWKHDPAFYSATSLGFGPKVHEAMAIPRLPIPADRLDAFRVKLGAVPALFAQARANLTDPSGDLARLAIRQKQIERRVYGQLAADVAAHHPDLVEPARRAEAAAAEFLAWLEANHRGWTRPGGIGREHYDYYLKKVLLFPYSWEEMRIIGEREYERAVAFLKIEEHEHRALPMIEPADTLAEFERRREEADAELLAWLRRERIFTVPDYLVPEKNEGPYLLPADRDPARPGPFDPPVARHFFRQTEDRDPRPLRGHNVPGHLLDQLMRRRDPRPIRGTPRLFFVDGTRTEGLAFYWEEFMQQAGFLDGRPKAREINYILQAKRAARVLPELMMHANRWSFDEALRSLTSRTPYWMAPDDGIAMFDLELYLRQPGYGIGYYMGKVQLERLLAERAMQQGRAFSLTAFHDEFLAAGVIPISLIRWEMLGRDDEVKEMW